MCRIIVTCCAATICMMLCISPTFALAAELDGGTLQKKAVLDLPARDIVLLKDSVLVNDKRVFLSSLPSVKLLRGDNLNLMRLKIGGDLISHRVVLLSDGIRAVGSNPVLSVAEILDLSSNRLLLNRSSIDTGVMIKL